MPRRACPHSGGLGIAKNEARYSARPKSARVGGRSRQAEAEYTKQSDGGMRWMVAAMQIAQSVQTLKGQSQDQQEPADQQAIGVMMGDMFETVAVLGIVETLIFNFPTRFRHVVQAF